MAFKGWRKSFARHYRTTASWEIAGGVLSVGRRNVGPMPSEPECGRSLDILILDAAPLSQSMLISLLDAAGHRSYASESVDDALTAIEEFDFDLLLINANEPDTELLDFVKLLRFAQIGEPPLPIVLLTACCDEAKRLDCDEAGIDLVLEKPISPAALSRAVASCAAPERRRRGTAHDRQ